MGNRGKFRKALGAAGTIFKTPAVLNQVLSEPDLWKDYVIRQHAPMEEGLPVIRLNRINEHDSYDAGPVTFFDGGYLPADLALLRLMASIYRDCTYFEISTWRGESAASMAGVAKECYTLNLSVNDLRKMGVRARYIYMLGSCSGTLDNVVRLSGNSMTYDFGKLNRKFDVIFIDGDHHYEHVRNDTEQTFRHLVHPGSVVVWHDYARHPGRIRYEVLAGILDGTDASIHNEIYHVLQTRCAVYLKKKIQEKLILPV